MNESIVRGEASFLDLHQTVESVMYVFIHYEKEDNSELF
jgi:hypothetical protein